MRNSVHHERGTEKQSASNSSALHPLGAAPKCVQFCVDYLKNTLYCDKASYLVSDVTTAHSQRVRMRGKGREKNLNEREDHEGKRERKGKTRVGNQEQERKGETEKERKSEKRNEKEVDDG